MASVLIDMVPIMERIIIEQFTKLFADHIENAAEQLASVETNELLGALGAELVKRSQRPVQRPIGIIDSEGR